MCTYLKSQIIIRAYSEGQQPQFQSCHCQLPRGNCFQLFQMIPLVFISISLHKILLLLLLRVLLFSFQAASIVSIAEEKHLISFTPHTTIFAYTCPTIFPIRYVEIVSSPFSVHTVMCEHVPQDYFSFLFSLALITGVPLHLSGLYSVYTAMRFSSCEGGGRHGVAVTSVHCLGSNLSAVTSYVTLDKLFKH